jgi:dihydroxy-acid dehydratase
MSDKNGSPFRKKPEDLRSQQWFGRQDRDGFAYRSWVKGKGVPHDQFDGRPVIGICNTFSELTPCNSHFRTLAEQVKIGAPPPCCTATWPAWTLKKASVATRSTAWCC